MSDDTALAAKLFPGAAAEARQAKPAASGDGVASKLFPKAAAAPEPKPAAPGDYSKLAAKMFPGTAEGKPKAAEQPKADPAKGADQKAEQPQAKPEAAPQAVAAIASALAGQAELGLEADHPDTISFSKVAAEAGISPENAAKLAAWDAARGEAAWDAHFQA